MTIYNPNDAVEHNGSSYICITTTSSEPPSADWQLLAAKGEDSTVPGPPGADGTNGVDGADSTVPGPQGDPGPACPLTDLTDVTITAAQQGDLVYLNAAGEWVNYHHGDSDQFLKSGGDGADPSWAHPDHTTLSNIGTNTHAAIDTLLAHPILPEPAALMLMDGTASIKDTITGTSFTVAGTPTAAALLGATAPVISAAAYTSCKIATPFAAGQALSIMLILTTSWAGDDSAVHYLFDNRYGASDRISIFKYVNNTIRITTTAAAGTKYMAKTTTAANWAASVNHVVIGIIDPTNAQQIFLDGVAGASSSGAAGREAGVGAETFIGTSYAPASPVTGAILCAIWNRVLTAGEITALSAATTWASIPAIVDTNKGAYWHSPTSSLMVLDTAWKKITLT